MKYAVMTIIAIQQRSNNSPSIRLQPRKSMFVVLHCRGSARGGAQLQLANLLPCGFAA